MKKIILIVFLLISLDSIACLNGETKILKNDVFVYEDYNDIIPRGHNFQIENFPKLLNELDSLYRKTKDLDYLSDKGYILIIQKKYSEALEIYSKIERLKPNRYSTASNLGTVYELLGENEKALFWINRAVQISPKSHNGSEWLHIKILKAKIGGPKYFNSDFLINTNFGNNDEPQSNLSKVKKDKLIKSLYYQLNERVSFIKTDDEIIGLLLFELGNLAILNKKNDKAVKIYQMSLEYGLNSNLLKNRIEFSSWKAELTLYNKINQLEKNLKESNDYYSMLLIIISSTSLIIITLLIFIILKKR